jgi:hypothetical protein
MVSATVVGVLKAAWEAVGELGVPAAVIDGLALTAWRHPRNTRDVDILIGFPATTDTDTVLRAMQAHGFRPLRFPVLVDVGTARFFQLLYTPPGTFVDIKIDLQLAESDYQQTALDRRRTFEWPEYALKVQAITCEDLILHKLAAGRLIDRADVVRLIDANSETLDYRYLALWLRRLSLMAEWIDCWREEHPSQPDPVQTVDAGSSDSSGG